MALLGGVSDVIALHTGLAKLSYLRVLSIADFLTGRVMGLFSNLSFLSFTPLKCLSKLIIKMSVMS